MKRVNPNDIVDRIKAQSGVIKAAMPLSERGRLGGKVSSVPFRTLTASLLVGWMRLVIIWR